MELQPSNARAQPAVRDPLVRVRWRRLSRAAMATRVATSTQAPGYYSYYSCNSYDSYYSYNSYNSYNSYTSYTSYNSYNSYIRGWRHLRRRRPAPACSGFLRGGDEGREEARECETESIINYYVMVYNHMIISYNTIQNI